MHLWTVSASGTTLWKYKFSYVVYRLLVELEWQLISTRISIGPLSELCTRIIPSLVDCRIWPIWGSSLNLFYLRPQNANKWANCQLVYFESKDTTVSVTRLRTSYPCDTPHWSNPSLALAALETECIVSVPNGFAQSFALLRNPIIWFNCASSHASNSSFVAIHIE